MHQANLGPILAHDPSHPVNGPWTLNDINYHRCCGEDKIKVPKKLEWDSDSDNVVQAEAGFAHYG
jgi:hypothetical protein